MKYRKGSLAPEIVRLAKDGMRAAEIARVVGCKRPNVYHTLTRHGVISHGAPRNLVTTRISVLSGEDRIWLRQEAKRLKVSWRDLARAILTDAIYEARNGKD